MKKRIQTIILMLSLIGVSAIAKADGERYCIGSTVYTEAWPTIPAGGIPHA